MSTWILLLRGINVGGKNRLRMKALVEILRALGLEQVQTYIQSGNVVFQSSETIPPTLEADLAATIEQRHGFRPRVLLLRAERLKQAMAANPFPEAEADPKTLHLFFLASAPAAPDLASLAEAASTSERFHLGEQVFYLHAPDGIGRSKLAATVEKSLGVTATARNWRTLKKIRDMTAAS